MAKVAIITRTKNRIPFLERNLKSVANQSYKDWIHIVVNDGGDPESVVETMKNYMQTYPHKYIVLHNEQSIGMEAASNIGIKNSRSEYITFLDDDDTWEADFLTKTVGYLENKKNSYLGGVVSQSVQVIEEVDIEGKINIINRKVWNSELKCVSFCDLVSGNSYAINSFLYKRECLEKVGLYCEDLPVLGDWHFNLRFLSFFEIDVLTEALSNYHYRKAGTGANANTQVCNKDLHQKYRTIIQNSFVRQDIQQNKIGIGFYLMQGHIQEKLNNTINKSTISLKLANFFFQFIRKIVKMDLKTIF